MVKVPFRTRRAFAESRLVATQDNGRARIGKRRLESAFQKWVPNIAMQATAMSDYTNCDDPPDAVCAVAGHCGASR
jgi:hypothetical protein